MNIPHFAVTTVRKHFAKTEFHRHVYAQSYIGTSTCAMDAPALRISRKPYFRFASHEQFMDDDACDNRQSSLLVILGTIAR